MKKIVLILAALAIGQMLHAQSDIIVREANCKNATSAGTLFEGPKNAVIESRYAVDCTSFTSKIFPGQRLSMNGCVQVPKGCKVHLLFRNQPIVLDGGKTHNLSEATSEIVKASKLSFFSRFLAYVGNSMDATKDEKALIENHRKHMESVRAGISGFGEKDYAIKTNLLMQGNVSSDNLTFTWMEIEGADGYLFTLVRKRDKTELIMKRVYGNAFEIVAGEVSFDQGEEYTWQVSAVSDVANPAKSMPQTFTYNPEGSATIMSDLSKNPDFQQGSEEDKALMYAYALEEGNYFYDAEMNYAAAMYSSPENKLVLNIVAAFYARMDMLEKAQTILQQ